MKESTFENINFVVSEEFNETRLDLFIFQMCDFLSSRSYAAKLIKNKFVLVDGKIRKSSYLLETHETVNIDLSFLHDTHSIPKAEFIPLDILYEDADILVLHKPSGLVVHPGAGVLNGTLVNALLAHCGGIVPSLGNPSRAGIVHRLDRDTSGVMITAKTQAALTELSKQFAEHTHKRIYHAICYGIFDEKSGYLETGHGRDPNNRIKYKALPLGEGKRAALKYRVLKEFSLMSSPRGCVSSRGDTFSLVECTLETGRTHQIRVQMSYLKHGIVGDSLYSPAKDSIKVNPKILLFLKTHAQRQLLHAVSLEFTHPKTKLRMEFKAPYPKDFKSFIDHLDSLDIENAKVKVS